jgi:hypothetical protein
MVSQEEESHVLSDHSQQISACVFLLPAFARSHPGSNLWFNLFFGLKQELAKNLSELASSVIVSLFAKKQSAQ